MLWQQLEALFLIAVMAILAVTDVRIRIIPNKIILPSILAAVIIQIIHTNVINILVAVVSFILLAILFQIDSNLIGGGDIKLIFFMALMIGPDMKGIILMFSIYTIAILVYYLAKEKITKEKQIFPLALSLFLAVITELLMR